MCKGSISSDCVGGKKMKTVMVNQPFKDRYDTSKTYVAGKTYQLTEERITEIRGVNPNLITVIGPSVAAVESAEATEEPEIPEEPENIEEVEKPKRAKKDTTKVEE